MSWSGDPSLNEQSLTGTNATMGSPTHMAPERWLSAKSVDHRSDVWSLGAVILDGYG